MLRIHRTSTEYSATLTHGKTMKWFIVLRPVRFFLSYSVLKGVFIFIGQGQGARGRVIMCEMAFFKTQMHSDLT